MGLVAFYRAMAVGTISLIAPITRARRRGADRRRPRAPAPSPSALALVGMVVALAGAALAARAPGPASRRGVGLAVVAALGFGGFFSLLAEGADRAARSGRSRPRAARRCRSG